MPSSSDNTPDVTSFAAASPPLAHSLAAVYEDARRRASTLRRKECPEHTWRTTDLLHEGAERLVRTYEHIPPPMSSLHTLYLLERAMENALTDHARARKASKRGNGVRPSELREDYAIPHKTLPPTSSHDELGIALSQLDDQLRTIIIMAYLHDMSDTNIGQVLGTSPDTARRRRIQAEALLRSRLG